jgi:hypothetical protein
MIQLDDTDTIDDAADTLRFVRPDLTLVVGEDFDFEAPTDPDATSIYDLTPTPVRYVGRERSPRRRQIRDTRENVLRLREALAEGWDIGPELAHEERRLSALLTAERAR